MSYANRTPHQPTPRVQRLVALGIVAVLAFSLGVAAAPISRRLGLLMTRSQPVAAAPPGSASHHGRALR